MNVAFEPVSFRQASRKAPIESLSFGPVALKTPFVPDATIRIVQSPRSRTSMNWMGSVGFPARGSRPPSGPGPAST